MQTAMALRRAPNNPHMQITKRVVALEDDIVYDDSRGEHETIPKVIGSVAYGDQSARLKTAGTVDEGAEITHVRVAAAGPVLD